MSDNKNFKRLEIRADELEQRIFALEKKGQKKTGVNEFEETLNMTVYQNPFKKYFLINADEKTCACLDLSVTKESEQGFKYSVSCGDFKISRVGIAPFNTQIALPLNVGKNVICLEIDFDNFYGIENFCISAKFKGKAINQPIEPFIDYVNDSFLAVFIGDTLSFYSVDDYEIKMSVTGIETCSVGASDDEIFALCKTLSGERKIYTFDPYSAKPYDEYGFKESFSRCAISFNEGVKEYYLIKSGVAYCLYIKGDETNMSKALFKANDVGFYDGKYRRYLYYYDLNDNCVVLEKEYGSDETVKKHALGKVKNVRLCEIDERLFAVYNYGEGIAQLDLSDGTIEYLAVGDECVKFNADKYMIRRGNEILKGE